MSASDITADTDTVSNLEPEAPDAHDHPSDRSYVNIALILGALTAIEILFFVFEDELGATPVKLGLLALMAVKFWMVGSFFMHLKFDAKILTGLFVFGLVLAVAVYFVMLSAFEFSFWNDGLDDPGLPSSLSG